MKIIVTGATGWIGRSAIEEIDRSLPQDIEVIGVSRSSKQLILNSGRTVKLVTRTDESIQQNVIGIIHAAFPTQNLITHMGPDKYNSVLIGRLFSASGRFMTKPKSYALGDFITSGILGETISVRSLRESKRSYIDAEEFLGVLLKSVNKNERLVVDSSGIVLSILELATIVQKFFPKSTLEVPSKLQSGSDDYFSRDPLRFENLAKTSNVEISGIDEQISRTIAGIIKSSQF